MLRTDLDRIERILLWDRASTARSVLFLRAHAEDVGAAPSTLLEPSLDPVTRRAAREQALGRVARVSRVLAEIDQALERLYGTPGVFGRCRACRSEIPLCRLEIEPHTRYCPACTPGGGEAT